MLLYIIAFVSLFIIGFGHGDKIGPYIKELKHKYSFGFLVLVS